MLVCPLKCRLIGIVDELEGSVDDIVWVLEFCVLEELGRFNYGGGDGVKACREISLAANTRTSFGPEAFQTHV